MQGLARPIRVTAIASNGVAESIQSISFLLIELIINLTRRCVGPEVCRGHHQPLGTVGKPQEQDARLCIVHGFVGGWTGRCAFATEVLLSQSRRRVRGSFPIHFWTIFSTYCRVTADQAHRGYTIATDDDGFASVNPMCTGSRLVPRDIEFDIRCCRYEVYA